MKVFGLSTGPISNGAYALILEQVDGDVRVPIVIADAEARSIAARMEHLTLPRPLTHDLFASFAQAFGIAMQEVFIHKFEDGIFYSEIAFTDGERRVVFDSRTSDAVAIAMRTGAPIYIAPEVLHECGFVVDESTGKAHTPEPTVEDLEQQLKKLVEQEQYEEAAKINDILKNKKNNNQ